jgi:hypothetical protein
MYERSLGAASFWWPYLRSVVPTREIGIAFCWPEQELAMLRGSEMEHKASQQQDRLAREWRTFVQPLSEKHPDLFPSAQFSHESYVSACSVIISR